jgi:hypothetical protein
MYARRAHPEHGSSENSARLASADSNGGGLFLVAITDAQKRISVRAVATVQSTPRGTPKAAASRSTHCRASSVEAQRRVAGARRNAGLGFGKPRLNRRGALRCYCGNLNATNVQEAKDALTVLGVTGDGSLIIRRATPDEAACWRASAMEAGTL